MCCLLCCCCLPKYWRAHYFVIFSLSVLVSWILRDYVASKGHLDFVDAAAGQQHDNNTSNFVRYACVLPADRRGRYLSLPKSLRGRLHTGFAPLKLLLWAASVVGLLFIPNDSGRIYFEVSRAGAAVFLLLQLVAILDAVYTANERWLERAEAGEVWYRVQLLALAVATNGGTIAAIVVMFIWFDKPRSTAFVAATVAIFVVLTVVSLLPSARARTQRQLSSLVNGGILTSGACSLYCAFLCAVAVTNDPENPARQPRWLQVIGFLIALGTLLYTAQDVGKGTMRHVYGEGAEDEEDVHPLMYSLFHFVYVCGSMYSNMLFCNWSYSSQLAEFDFEKGEASMWVKVSCEWAVAVLYLWMLLAPAIGRRLCPHRDFGSPGSSPAVFAVPI